MIYALDEENNFYRAQLRAIVKFFQSLRFSTFLALYLRLIVCINLIENTLLNRRF